MNNTQQLPSIRTEYKSKTVTGDIRVLYLHLTAAED